MSDSNESNHPSSFDTEEQEWFSSERPTRRPSQRPTRPAPALSPVPGIDDSIAGGWFLDL
jgi:hypothetical protein